MSSLNNFIPNIKPKTELELPQGFEYVSNFLTQKEADNLFEQLVKEIEWEEREIKMFGKVYMQPRLIKWFGDKAYSYSKQEFQAQRMPQIVEDLREKVQEYTGAKCNSVLINYYRNEQDSMGKHSDDEKELGVNPTIISISVGEEREFVIINKLDKSRIKLNLEHGSLLIMNKDSQHKYWHELPKSRTKKGGRINLTFRYIY
ncbi:MAG: alpha-ketoglutarate-dependent dioxygenase AlkB [Nanoarchaeota archaeon]|nr:alpha-ketoglutarate-dependent dioxygenase AlkB [Nanoarchaeota archaeon]